MNARRAIVPLALLAIGASSVVPARSRTTDWQTQLHLTAPRMAPATTAALELRDDRRRPRVLRRTRNIAVWMPTPIPWNGELLMLDGKLYAPVREFVSFLNDRFPRMPALQVDWDSQTRRVYVRREAEGGSLVRIRTLPIRGGVRMSARPVSVGATKGAPSVAAGAEPEAALVGEGAFAAGVTLLGVGDARGALVQLREARTQGMADAQPVADWLHGAPQALGTLRLRWSEDLPKGQVLLDGVPVEAETFAVVTTAGEHRLTWQPQDGPQTSRELAVSVKAGEARTVTLTR